MVHETSLNTENAHHMNPKAISQQQILNIENTMTLKTKQNKKAANCHDEKLNRQIFGLFSLIKDTIDH